MKIAIGADHAGYELKEEIKNLLKNNAIDFHDFGTHLPLDSKDDYPDYAREVAEAISQGRFDRGIHKRFSVRYERIVGG